MVVLVAVMVGRRQVVLLWLALVCFLACAVLHVSSAPAAAAGNADAGEGDSHASTWPRSWAKEKMVEKLSTLTDVSARYIYIYHFLGNEGALAFDERQARR